MQKAEEFPLFGDVEEFHDGWLDDEVSGEDSFERTLKSAEIAVRVQIISNNANNEIMTTQSHWLTSAFDPASILKKEVFVLDKAGRKIAAALQIEHVNSRGQLIVLAEYNSSPHAGTIVLSRAYLTQEELNSCADNGLECILKTLPD